MNSFYRLSAYYWKITCLLDFKLNFFQRTFIAQRRRVHPIFTGEAKWVSLGKNNFNEGICALFMPRASGPGVIFMFSIVTYTLYMYVYINIKSYTKEWHTTLPHPKKKKVGQVLFVAIHPVSVMMKPAIRLATFLFQGLSFPTLKNSSSSGVFNVLLEGKDRVSWKRCSVCF